MHEITQIRFAGFGGQGIVLAGMLLGIAGINDGLNVANSNSYGAQARGTACKAEVVLGEKDIIFPHVLTSDYLIAMSEEAYRLFLPAMSNDGKVLYDPYHVNPDRGTFTHFEVPATQTALDTFNRAQPANIIMLGAFSGITRIVSKEAITSAVRENVPERFAEMNIKALALGFELASHVKEKNRWL